MKYRELADRALRKFNHLLEVADGVDEAPSEGECGHDAARRICNQAGVRIMHVDGRYAIGIARQVDSAEIRAAIRSLRLDHLELLHLEDDRVPKRYRTIESTRVDEGRC